jgi:hypothetical protein
VTLAEVSRALHQKAVYNYRQQGLEKKQKQHKTSVGTNRTLYLQHEDEAEEDEVD